MTPWQQTASLLCPPLSPRVCSNSCPLSWWCYLTISSSATTHFFYLQSFPGSGSFPMSWLFNSSWSKYWSFSFSISPSSEYLGLISFKIDWFDLLAVQGTLKFSPTPQFESINSVLSFLYGYGSTHDSTQHLYMTNRKTIALLHGPLSDRAWQVTVYRITKTRTQLKWLSTHAPLSGK